MSMQPPHSGRTRLTMAVAVAAAVCCLIILTTSEIGVKATAQPVTYSIDYWSSQVPPTTYSGRYDTTAIMDSLNNIYMIGGLARQVPQNDVWMSSDSGSHWTCQTTNITDPRFSPRYYYGATFVQKTAGEAGTLVLVGGTPDGGTFLNDVWTSVNQGVNWVQVTNQADWPANFVRLVSDSQANLYVIVSTATGMDMWSASTTDNYQTWTKSGPVAIPNPTRTSFGVTVTPDDQLFLAGGSYQQQQQQEILYNDVYTVDLTQPTLEWKLLTASAPWTPRTLKNQLAFDGGNNLLAFGNWPVQTTQQVKDMLWMSPVGATRGINWIRVDNTSCQSAWPYKNVPDPDDFTVLRADSNGRLIIVGDLNNVFGQATGNFSTAFIQLQATYDTDQLNLLYGYQPWTPAACRPLAPSSSSTGSAGASSTAAPIVLSSSSGPSTNSTGGNPTIGTGAAVAIVLCTLFGVGLMCFGLRWWYTRSSFSQGTIVARRLRDREGGYSFQEMH